MPEIPAPTMSTSTKSRSPAVSPMRIHPFRGGCCHRALPGTGQATGSGAARQAHADDGASWCPALPGVEGVQLDRGVLGEVRLRNGAVFRVPARFPAEVAVGGLHR